MARLFTEVFGVDGQPPAAAAAQTAPPINSRTGQHSSVATDEKQRRVVTTDALAHVVNSRQPPSPVSVSESPTETEIVKNNHERQTHSITVLLALIASRQPRQAAAVATANQAIIESKMQQHLLLQVKRMRI